jgi:hypothetical protein
MAIQMVVLHTLTEKYGERSLRDMQTALEKMISLSEFESMQDRMMAQIAGTVVEIIEGGDYIPPWQS